MNSNFKVFILSLLSLFFALSATAQSDETLVVAEVEDSLSIPILDSLYYGRDIFSLIGERGLSFNGSIVVRQGYGTRALLAKYIESAKGEKLSGYRIRIFFDNDRSAREKSEELVTQFREDFPGIAVYRSYENPYFKVTVGDFRNRSEATAMLRRLRSEFPAAFIVRDEINFPPLENYIPQN